MKSLVAEDKFDVGVTSGTNRILPHLVDKTIGGVRRFVMDVVAQLRVTDYAGRVSLKRKTGKGFVVHDEYATRVSQALAEKHLDKSHKTT